MFEIKVHHSSSPVTDLSCSKTVFLLFQAVLSPLIAIALKISQIHERTGRRGPTVITWRKKPWLTRPKGERSAGDTSPTPSCYLFVPLMTLEKTIQKIIFWWGWGGWENKKICFVWVLVSSSQCSGVFNNLLKPHYHFPWYVITQRNLPFWERVSGLGNCSSWHLGISGARWEKVLKCNGGESNARIEQTPSHRDPWADLRRPSSAWRRI